MYDPSVLRRLSLLLLAVCLLVSPGTQAPSIAATEEGIIVSGGDLPRPVGLSFVDADAFVRRLAPPPKLRNAPDVDGPSYTLVSTYWQDALRLARNGAGTAAPEATYYQNGGYVRTLENGQDAWLVLDLRQRAIVDRYIAFARAGRPEGRPGVLQVLRHASDSEPIGIEMAGRALGAEERDAFWRAFDSMPQPLLIQPPQPLSRPQAGTWLVFTLAEGRSVHFFYDQSSPRLVDSFGSEAYEVSPAMLGTLGGLGDRPPGTFEIVQEDGPGSVIWLGALLVIGMAAIGVAVLLRTPSKRSA